MELTLEDRLCIAIPIDVTSGRCPGEGQCTISIGKDSAFGFPSGDIKIPSALRNKCDIYQKCEFLWIH